MTKLLPRFRFQYSLRTLLIGVTVFCVLCSTATYIGWKYIGNLFWSTLCSVGSYIGWQAPLAILVLAAVGGAIAWVRGVEFVRLFGAVIVALLACWFVSFYDSSAYIRFQFDHPGGISRTPLGEYIQNYNKYAYAFPALGLMLGCVFGWLWPRSKVLLEVVIQSLWILAVGWTALVLLTWEIQNIPVFRAMQWRY